MISKAFAAFGTVVFNVTLTPGERWVVDLRATEGNYLGGIYYFVQGTCKCSVEETGEVLPDRGPGYLNIERPDGKPRTVGKVLMDAQDAVEWICVPKLGLRNKMPASLTPHELSAPTDFGNTNLFLAKGKVTIGAKQFTGPAQIRVRSGSATLTPEGTAYLLEFPYADAGMA